MSRVRARAGETNRRQDIEDMLIENQVTHTYREGISTRQFDQEKGLRNQARLGKPLNEIVVAQYKEAIENGDIFPPLLVERQGDKYVALDGNHRLRAHAQAGEAVDVYICEGSRQQLTLLTFLGNSKHGLPSSTEDRLHHALHVVDNGMSQSEASRLFSVPKRDLAKAIAKQNANRRADDAGIRRPDWECIPVSARARLNNVHTDEGFRAAVKLTREAGLGTEDVFKMVGRMNETKNASRQVQIVDALRLQYSEHIAAVRTQGATNRPGKKAASSPRARLASVLGMLTALPPPEAYEALDIPEDTLKDLVGKVDNALASLQALRGSLTGPSA